MVSGRLSQSYFILLQPSELQWKKLNQKGDVPSGRSGHSLTSIGAYNYLLYGGIEESKSGKVQPNGEIFTMKASSSKFI